MRGSHTLAVMVELSEGLRTLSNSKDRLESDRARAIMTSMEGRRRLEIASILHVNEDELSRWRGRLELDNCSAGCQRRGPGVG